MSRSLIFSEKALLEFEDAVGWYEEKRRGLGAQFVLYVEAKLERVRKSPELFQTIYSNYRRALLKRFPYAIIFELVGNDIQVLAIYHSSRQPQNFSDRR